MAKELIETIGVDRVRPRTYVEHDGYTWQRIGKDMHIAEWGNAYELCGELRFSRFVNRDGQLLFRVRDGERVIETSPDGTQQTLEPAAMLPLSTPNPETIWINCKSIKLGRVAAITGLWIMTIPKAASMQPIIAASI